MLITAFFTDRGIPKTGFTPLVSIWEPDGSLVVDEQNMTERAGGFYDYAFAGYDESKSYTIRADGGTSLSLGDRYKFSSNEVELGKADISNLALETTVQDIKDICGGRWYIDQDVNQLVLFKPDNVTEVARFNLFDKNGDPASIGTFDRRRA